jgi:hypothetical protein
LLHGSFIKFRGSGFGLAEPPCRAVSGISALETDLAS